jgi:membrane dipeptidase
MTGVFRGAVTGLVLALAAVPAAAQQAAPDPALVARAERILREVPLIDGHNDIPSQVLERGGSLQRVDLEAAQPELHTDLARLRRGRLGAQFWSAYVTVDSIGRGALRHALREIDTVHRLEARYPWLQPARTADDIVRAHEAGRIASLIGVEGGHAIEGSLAALRMFHDLGVRYMTLTHSATHDWADASTDYARHGGLSEFGEEVVREMNRVGIFVDLSHVSPATMHDALRVSRAPVIFSHSSARGVTDHPRNVPDEVLRELPQNGGVVMVTFVPPFVNEQINRWAERRDSVAEAARAALDDPAAIRERLAAWDAANPTPRATLSDVADHIDHIRRVAGVDHIGIGSDFDGITSVPVGLEDVSTFPALFAELLRRGYSEQDLKKIAGLNVLRAMRRMEETARQLQTERAPSLADLAPGR